MKLVYGLDDTIKEEVEALEQYLILQQIRYDFKFDVRIISSKQGTGTTIILQLPIQSSHNN